jgi:hypothetical protein
LVVLISVGLILVWKVQGMSMRSDFVRALRTGDIHGPHRDLVGKTWSDEELATAEVLKVPEHGNVERSLERSIHALGRVVVPSQRYGYQGSVRDASTGSVHVFGRTRTAPHRWCWYGISLSDIPQHLERRMRQVEEMHQRAKEKVPREAGASGSAGQ